VRAALPALVAAALQVRRAGTAGRAMAGVAPAQRAAVLWVPRGVRRLLIVGRRAARPARNASRANAWGPLPAWTRPSVVPIDLSAAATEHSMLPTARRTPRASASAPPSNAPHRPVSSHASTPFASGPPSTATCIVTMVARRSRSPARPAPRGRRGCATPCPPSAASSPRAPACRASRSSQAGQPLARRRAATRSAISSFGRA
jgi:hypothetical protein